MRAKLRFSFLAVLAVIVFSLTFSIHSYAQCYMSQGCDPLDNLAYRSNEATGQIYHGDGATNNGNGGWTTNYAGVNQCTACHGDMGGYLMTGHKNTLRKLAPVPPRSCSGEGPTVRHIRPAITITDREALTTGQMDKLPWVGATPSLCHCRTGLARPTPAVNFPTTP